MLHVSKGRRRQPGVAVQALLVVVQITCGQECCCQPCSGWKQAEVPVLGWVGTQVLGLQRGKCPAEADSVKG